jgi:glycosyltransferase involved in cell wall biosynthesis
MPPLISCIVPVFNGERFLAEALESILSQTYQPIEIIVVDDGSTDQTAQVAHSYGQRIKYLRKTNGGETAARNHGLRAAKGEYVAFLDADDLWHPYKLAQQMARFRETPELDLCFTRFQNYWMAEVAGEGLRYRDHPLSRPSSAYCICTFLARRIVFERFGFFADDVLRRSQNVIWFLHAAGRGARLEVLPEVLTYRRFHSANLSRASAIESIFPIAKAWRDYKRARTGS